MYIPDYTKKPKDNQNSFQKNNETAARKVVDLKIFCNSVKLIEMIILQANVDGVVNSR